MRMPNVVSREEWQAIADRLPSAPAPTTSRSCWGSTTSRPSTGSI